MPRAPFAPEQPGPFPSGGAGREAPRGPPAADLFRHGQEDPGLRGCLYTLFFRQTLPPFGSQSCQLGLLQNTHSIHKCVCAFSSHTLLDSRRRAAKAAAGEAASMWGESNSRGFTELRGSALSPFCPAFWPPPPAVQGTRRVHLHVLLSPFVNDLLPIVKEIRS